MTERKPPDISFESWVDRQILPHCLEGRGRYPQADARGEFSRLEGAGKPLSAETEAPYDEMWWIKRKMAEEGLTALHPTLALRKEAEDALEAAYAAPSEAAARRIITAVNAKIRTAMYHPQPGPPLGKKPFDVESVAREWRARHAA